MIGGAMQHIDRMFNMELSTHRIEALCDGVYAIAMTLLILSFDIITPTERNIGLDINQRLIDQWPDLLHYVESFVILAFFWVRHHQQFHFIKRSDYKILWWNIAALMFLCLIPFSTSIVSDFGHLKTVSIVFESNIFVVGLLYYMQWAYATKNHRLVDKDLGNDVIKAFKAVNLVVPAVSLVTIAVSLFLPRLGTSLYILLPFVPVVKRKIF
jgi:uncharacterized membrane protein